MIKEIKDQKEPLVSVIVPAYNHENYVAECLKSIISQTYENIELIAINDGSYDNTHNVILNLAGGCRKRFKRFKYVNKRKNEGIAKTLNQGILLSKGKYISFLASDDIIMPDKIELLVSEFEKLDNDYAVVCGDATFIDENSKKIYLDKQGNISYKKCAECYNSFLEYYTRHRTDFDYKREFGLYETFLLGNYIPAMSTLIKKEILMDVGLFDEGCFIEDYDIWLKLSKKYKFKYVDRPVAFYRLHSNNAIKVLKKELQLSTAQLLVREKSYCYANGFENKWKEGFYSVLIGLLKNRCYTNFISYLRMINNVDFFTFALRKFSRKYRKNGT